jgi:pimeloyl-ACP methyl ester carboxylesterase
MTELAVNFGPASDLVGILSGAEEIPWRTPGPRADRAASDLGVIFLNAGVIHRVGPNRIHVSLARALARLGIPTLRFDLPGVGDSGCRYTGGSLQQERDAAIACAVELMLTRTSARRLVLFGLCSGADDAFRTACFDARVVGVCLVDPTRLFPTFRSRLLLLLRWLARPSGWLRLARGRYQLLRHLFFWAGLPTTPPIRARPRARPPSPEEHRMARAALRLLVGRNVRICYIVTGDKRRLYNYRSQLLDAFPHLGLERVTRLELFPRALHTLPDPRDRARLQQVLTSWLHDTEFPTIVPATASVHGLG